MKLDFATKLLYDAAFVIAPIVGAAALAIVSRNPQHWIGEIVFIVLAVFAVLLRDFVT